MLCLNQFSWQWLLRLVGSLVYLIQLLNLVLGLNKLNSSPITLTTTTFIKALHAYNKLCFPNLELRKRSSFCYAVYNYKNTIRGGGGGGGLRTYFCTYFLKTLLEFADFFTLPLNICYIQIKLNQTPGNSTKLCYTPRKI